VFDRSQGPNLIFDCVPKSFAGANRDRYTPRSGTRRLRLIVWLRVITVLLARTGGLGSSCGYIVGESVGKGKERDGGGGALLSQAS
jgi:hypothetical protein